MASNKLIKGKNDLLTKFPEIAKDWNWDKNKDGPSDVMAGSDRKRWFVCPNCKHTWESSIKNRTCYGKGCPKCKSSKAEKAIARILDELGIYYEPQKVFKDCRDKAQLKFDFYIPSLNLLIEYNGRGHYEQIANWDFEGQRRRDKIKYEYCQRLDTPKLIIISYKWKDKLDEIVKLIVYIYKSRI